MAHGIHPARRHDLPAERRVLQAFLALDGEARWSIEGLKVKLEDIAPERVVGALVELAAAGVLIHEGATMRLSPAAAHMTVLVPPPDDQRYGEAMQRVLARQALADYARRRAESCPSTEVISELAPLVDRALAAGLALDEIRELATETFIPPPDRERITAARL
jgi:hypothetical protein